MKPSHFPVYFNQDAEPTLAEIEAEARKTRLDPGEWGIARWGDRDAFAKFTV
jgi:hypothetical protein